MLDLLLNTPLVAAFTATVVAQALKVLLVLATERRLAFDRLLETGGMPSSHSAAVAAVATVLGIQYGLGSPYFALAAVFEPPLRPDFSFASPCAGWACNETDAATMKAMRTARENSFIKFQKSSP